MGGQREDQDIDPGTDSRGDLLKSDLSKNREAESFPGSAGQRGNVWDARDTLGQPGVTIDDMESYGICEDGCNTSTRKKIGVYQIKLKMRYEYKGRGGGVEC